MLKTNTSGDPSQWHRGYFRPEIGREMRAQ